MQHGAVLRNNFFSAQEVDDIVHDYHNAGLAPAEVSLIAFAEKVTLYADQITQDDIDDLRANGFTDAEVLDIALAAAARSFYSKMMDAVGVVPSSEWLDKTETLLGQELLQALTVGRAFTKA